jgi:hypothetical protein
MALMELALQEKEYARTTVSNGAIGALEKGDTCEAGDAGGEGGAGDTAGASDGGGEERGEERKEGSQRRQRSLSSSQKRREPTRADERWASAARSDTRRAPTRKRGSVPVGMDMGVVSWRTAQSTAGNRSGSDSEKRRSATSWEAGVTLDSSVRTAGGDRCFDSKE